MRKWKTETKKIIWAEIVRGKIIGQISNLPNDDHYAVKLLSSYVSEIEAGDTKNREAHAAKVYFNSLFGKDFSRIDDHIINAALNYGELTDIANHDFPHELSELYCKIHALLSDTVFSCGMDITFDEINDITPIIKLYNVRPDIEDHSLLGKLLIYMELCEKYLKKKLFIILNLHSCCSQEELDCFFKDIVYRKNNILLLETHLEDASKYEKVLIVDKDMCEI